VELDPSICGNRCVREYGNQCQYFCPTAVYEMAIERGQPKLKINAANCVHRKSCDIADPYQTINLISPEGGGGPNYEGMQFGISSQLVEKRNVIPRSRRRGNERLCINSNL
jgi:ferredoxin-like protein FixX